MTPVAIVGVTVFAVAALVLASLLRVVDTQIHLAALAEQVALTQAQRLLAGEAVCRRIDLPPPYVLAQCQSTETDVMVDLDQRLSLGWIDLTVTARGRYLLNA